MIVSPLTPYRGPFTELQATHLLRRAAFGAPPAEAQRLAALGLYDAVDDLLTYPAAEQPQNPFDPATAENPGESVRLATARWLYELLNSPYPLREYLTLVWHDHLPVGADKVRHGVALRDYLQALREHGLGRFEELLLAVAKSPAMLRYLDNDRNVRSRPNENFARELMELFTVGLGPFDEDDVREAARAFTGWSFQHQDGRAPQFVFRRRAHDSGVKSVLGVRGRLGGEDVIAICAQHPATATTVARKLWQAFVADQPDDDGVAALAAVFRASDGDLHTTLRTLLTSNAFYAADRTVVRSPIHFLVGTLRTLELPLTAKHYPGLLRLLERWGQLPLWPPNVSGWPGGRAWIADGALLARLQALLELTGNDLLAARFDDHPSPAADATEALEIALIGRPYPPLAALGRGLSAAERLFLVLASPEAAVL